MRKLITLLLFCLSVGLRAQVQGPNGTNTSYTLTGIHIGDGSQLTNLPGSQAGQSGTAFNIIQNGADPTGAADSTAAVQNAVNTNKVVLIPTGNFLFSGITVTNPGEVIYGLGTNSHLTLAYATNGQIAINSTNAPGCYFHDFSLYGTNFVFGQGVATTQPIGIAASMIGHTVIQNCQIQGFVQGISCYGSDAIFSRPQAGMVLGNCITNCYDGIVLNSTNQAEYVEIGFNQINQCYISLNNAGAANDLFHDNIITGNGGGYGGYGIFIHPANSTIPGDGNRGHSSYVGNIINHTPGICVNSASNCFFEANHIFGSGTIALTNAVYCIFQGNTIECQSPWNWINFGAGCVSNVFRHEYLTWDAVATVNGYTLNSQATFSDNLQGGVGLVGPYLNGFDYMGVFNSATNAEFGNAFADSRVTVNGNVEVYPGGGLLFNVYYTNSQWLYTGNGTGAAFYNDGNAVQYLTMFTNNTGGHGAVTSPTSVLTVTNSTGVTWIKNLVVAALTDTGTNNITNNLAYGLSAGTGITLSGGVNGAVTISASGGGGGQPASAILTNVSNGIGSNLFNLQAIKAYNITNAGCQAGGFDNSAIISNLCVYIATNGTTSSTVGGKIFIPNGYWYMDGSIKPYTSGGGQGAYLEFAGESEYGSELIFACPASTNILGCFDLRGNQTTYIHDLGIWSEADANNNATNGIFVGDCQLHCERVFFGGAAVGYPTNIVFGSTNTANFTAATNLPFGGYKSIVKDCYSYGSSCFCLLQTFANAIAIENNEMANTQPGLAGIINIGTSVSGQPWNSADRISGNTIELNGSLTNGVWLNYCVSNFVTDNYLGDSTSGHTAQGIYLGPQTIGNWCVPNYNDSPQHVNDLGTNNITDLTFTHVNSKALIGCTGSQTVNNSTVYYCPVGTGSGGASETNGQNFVPGLARYTTLHVYAGSTALVVGSNVTFYVYDWGTNTGIFTTIGPTGQTNTTYNLLGSNNLISLVRTMSGAGSFTETFTWALDDQ